MLGSLNKNCWIISPQLSSDYTFRSEILRESVCLSPASFGFIINIDRILIIGRQKHVLNKCGWPSKFLCLILYKFYMLHQKKQAIAEMSNTELHWLVNLPIPEVETSTQGSFTSAPCKRKFWAKWSLFSMRVPHNHMVLVKPPNIRSHTPCLANVLIITDSCIFFFFFSFWARFRAVWDVVGSKPSESHFKGNQPQYNFYIPPKTVVRLHMHSYFRLGVLWRNFLSIHLLQHRAWRTAGFQWMFIGWIFKERIKGSRKCVCEVEGINCSTTTKE